MANNTTLALVKKDTVDIVSTKIRQFQEKGELCLPANYSPENAMKSAWLLLQETVDRNGKPACDVCTRDSIANALLDMVVQSLNPVKKQCYFIVYGSKLQLQRSYFGTMHVAKAVNPNIVDIVSDIVYAEDEFEYEKIRGKNVITKHKQKISNIDKSKIIAAYCTIIYSNDKEESIIMTFDEIKQAWKQSKMSPINDKGEIKLGTTHDKFTAEMAKKTVTNRACKPIINASDDSNLMISAYKSSDDEDHDAKVEAEIQENANTIVVDVDEVTGEVIENEHPVDPEEMLENYADTGADF